MENMAVIDQEIEQVIANYFIRRDRALELLEKGGYPAPNHELGDNTNTDFAFPLKVATLSELRVACVMDRFSRDCYAPECQLLDLTPSGWRNELQKFQPDLIFIESAWEGKDKLWYRKIAGCDADFYDMIYYCREQEIPVVFWNKEDPVYTDTFMAAASLADVVFTTDIDCIAKYKSSLSHDRVYHLHFAAQPRIHNPIEKYNRKDKFCFAGAYYHRYKERAKVFDEFSRIFIDTKGFDIYDRNYQSARPEHAFPNEYSQYILGTLDSNQIDVAYKGYIYGVNMNSIQQSQTMFARRAFEMLASNTVTVGNYSRGMKNYFGDLTICTDDYKTLNAYIQRYCNDFSTLGKYRLAGVRKVLHEHLYEDRLDFVVEKVFGKTLKPALPDIVVLSLVKEQGQADKIIDMFDAQSYKNKSLILIGDGIGAKREDIIVVSEETAQKAALQELVQVDYIAVFDCRDYYDKNYLLDLALTTRYLPGCNGIGKSSYYERYNESVTCKNADAAYINAASMARRRAMVRLSVMQGESLYGTVTGEDFVIDGLFGSDIYNYCMNSGNRCLEAADLDIPDKGLTLDEINLQVSRVETPLVDLNATLLDAHDIYGSLYQPSDPAITVSAKEAVVLNSALPDNSHSYIYLNKDFSLSDFSVVNHKLSMQFYGVGSLEVSCVCVFYDGNGTKFNPVFVPFNAAVELSIPEEAARFILGFRLKGSGDAKIFKIVIGGEGVLAVQRETFLTRSNVLVLSNQYPTSENLYRNMFVHRRVLSYLEDACLCDVMRMNIYAKNQYREFEGINIVDGQAAMLSRVLDSGRINTVCVHFLDAAMWSVLKGYLDRIRILVWVHGSEIQPWWRREYNYITAADLEQGKKQSEETIVFWREVFSTLPNENLHFIFVSQYFADEVMEDHKIDLPTSSYSIIHNLVDTDVFTYMPKPAEQRKKILSIKPYASRKYANDLTTRAILSLSKHSAFKDLEFYLYGDGLMFEEDTKPLRRFKNVHLFKRFLTQAEISAIHKTCGVYIATTRMDAQGVSRDEAMSSGLVPIANAVAAIPEFVDETCGILVPGEDFEGVVQGVLRLYGDKKLFLDLSLSAAKRVRSQSSRPHTINEEIGIIKPQM